MDKINLVDHWLSSADRNLATSLSLYSSNHFDWALFIGQLALEKLLKGLILDRYDKPAPFTHDLVILSKSAGIEISEIQIEQLATITRFNIDARYDEIKSEFYKKATKEYSSQWLSIIKEVYSWIRTMYSTNK